MLRKVSTKTNFKQDGWKNLSILKICLSFSCAFIFYHEKAIKVLQRARSGVARHLSTTSRWEILLSAFPNGTVNKSAGLFSTVHSMLTSSREAVNTNFKVIGLKRLGIVTDFTASKADALTTRPYELAAQLKYIIVQIYSTRYKIGTT